MFKFELQILLFPIFSIIVLFLSFFLQQLLNNNKFNNLTFSEVKKGQFKCLDLAFKALKMGFNAPTILNASNEIAVEKFLENKIKFIDIPVIIGKALKYVPAKKNNSLSSILASDELTRKYTRELIKKI